MDKAVQKILECLRKAAPRDMSIEEIADETRLHRNTVSKYIYAMEQAGTISMTRTLGNAKLYAIPSQKKGS